MNELVIDGKTYVSSKRAAEITGYAKDYVGQLCREGRVEARLVGRAWYVLETSLREHRFGAEEAVSEPVKAEKPSITDTWASLRYEAEEVVEPVVPLVPAPEKPTVNILSSDYGDDALLATEEPEAPPQRLAESLADLQSAWKDWFSRKETPEPVAEDVEEQEFVAEEIEEEAIVPIRHVEEPEAVSRDIEEDEVNVPIERITARSYREPEPIRQYEEEEAVIIEERAARPRKRRAHGGLYALLVFVSVASIAIAFIGSGLADKVLPAASLSAAHLITGVTSYEK